MDYKHIAWQNIHIDSSFPSIGSCNDLFDTSRWRGDQPYIRKDCVVMRRDCLHKIIDKRSILNPCSGRKVKSQRESNEELS